MQTTKPTLSSQKMKEAFDKALKTGLTREQKEIISKEIKRSKEEGKGKKAFIDNKKGLIDSINSGRKELEQRRAQELSAPRINPKSSLKDAA